MFKTFLERSGARTLAVVLLFWLAASVPQWIGAVTLPDPWGRILADAGAFVAGALRLLAIHYRGEPVAPVSRLPPDVIARLPAAERARVAWNDPL